MIFARTKTPYGFLIRLGEWLKFRKCSFNHVAVVGERGIIQATLKGVTDDQPIDPKWEYVVIAPPCDRAKLLEFVNAQVGSKYSFLTILSIALDILSWNWTPALSNSSRQSWICSGLVGEGMRYGGWLHEFVNVYTVTPQALFESVAVSGEDVQ